MGLTAEKICRWYDHLFIGHHRYPTSLESDRDLSCLPICIRETSCKGQKPFVAQVADEILRVYDGSLWDWNLPPSDRVWQIAIGRRASVVGAHIGSRRCCVKLYYDDRLRTKVRSLFGWTRARRAFRFGGEASRSGVRCPQVFGHAKAGPIGPSLLVMELIEEAMPLDQWIAQRGLNRDFVRQFAAFVRQMHDVGISHIDLQPRNVLVRLCDPKEKGQPEHEFTLVDLEDIRVHRRVSHRTRMRNLRRLHKFAVPIVPLKWRLEFLKQYLHRRSLRGTLRQIGRAISSETPFRRWVALQRLQDHLQRKKAVPQGSSRYRDRDTEGRQSSPVQPLIETVQNNYTQQPGGCHAHIESEARREHCYSGTDFCFRP